MKAEDIRRLYRGEDPASEDEAKETADTLRTDPEQARRLLLTIYALASEDTQFEQLLAVVLKAALMQMLVRAVADDDAFALQIGQLISEAMDTLKPGSMRSRTPRGKPGKPRTA